MNRREVFQATGAALASIPALSLVGAVASAKPTVPQASGSFTGDFTRLLNVSSFKELEAALSELPDQCLGQPMSVCENGHRYVLVRETALARPADVAIIEAVVARRMAEKLSSILIRASGRIYWREPFEGEIWDSPLILRFDDAGPDLDPFTDRPCFLDKNWKCVGAYARLSRS